MLSFFTIPKAFHGHNAIIQRNAIQSWLQLRPDCEVILFGADDGISDIAEELNCKHIPDIEINEWGTPLLSDAFSVAQQIAKHDIVIYANADIIFFQDLIEAIQTISFPMFLLCGRRWDLDIEHEIDFYDSAWVKELRQDLSIGGKLHGPSGIDYFAFPKYSISMPPFAVGRPGWDSWLLYDVRCRDIPLVNATKSITAVHQNHDYSHSKFGEKKRVGGPEFKQNIKIAGGLTNMLTLRDADWLLTKDGPKHPSLLKRILLKFSLWYPWRMLLAVKRNLYIWLR